VGVIFSPKAWGKSKLQIGRGGERKPASQEEPRYKGMGGKKTRKRGGPVCRTNQKRANESNQKILAILKGLEAGGASKWKKARMNSLKEEKKKTKEEEER